LCLWRSRCRDQRSDRNQTMLELLCWSGYADAATGRNSDRDGGYEIVFIHAGSNREAMQKLWAERRDIKSMLATPLPN
jgi:hypothetical protein